MNDTSAVTKQPSKFTPTKRLNKRQKDFIEYWLNLSSPTFGNTYQSAVKAGFSDYSARVLTSNSHNLEWIAEAKKYMDRFTPEHIISGIQSLATSARADRDKINALALLTKVRGMQQGERTEVNITFANSVPRPLTDTQQRMSTSTEKAQPSQP